MIFWLSSQSRPLGQTLSNPVAYASHFTVYLVLVVLAMFALFGLPGAGEHRGRTVAASFILAALYGISDEIHQSVVPGRDPSLLDWLVDVAGSGTGAALAALVLWRR
jgi:VanZ family protein